MQSGMKNPLQYLEEFARTQDWSQFDQDHSEARFESDHAQWLHAQEIARPFSTPEGQIALQRLRQATIQAATFDADLGLLNGIAMGFAREGQNSVIRYIENCIRRAEEGPPEKPST